MTTTNPITVHDAISDYLLEQQVRGNTPKTQRYYSVCLGFFERFAGDKLPCSELTVHRLKEYYASLCARGLSSVSVQSYVRALRAFLSWSFQEEYMDMDLTNKFRLPKAKKTTVDVLTDNEVERLFDSFNTRSLIQLRNACICSLMVGSGLRMNEVVTLLQERLHMDEGYCIVDGKGNKQRIVPLSLHSRRLLRRYLSRRPACSDTGAVFLTQQLDPITENTCKMLFKRLKQTTDIPRLHAHLLRHTFATRYLENGGDMYALQMILGHTSLDMVKKYVHLTASRNIAEFGEYSPLDRVLKKTS